MLTRTLPWLLLAGCGAADFKEDAPPAAPFPPFSGVEIRIATPDVAVPEDVRAELDAFAGALPKRLDDVLRRRNLLAAEGGSTLVVDLRIVAYDPGSRAARYIFGFGLGTGSVDTRAEFRDGATLLGSGTARGTVWGGMFGGSMSTAHHNVVRAIVDYVERCSRGR